MLTVPVHNHNHKPAPELSGFETIKDLMSTSSIALLRGNNCMHQNVLWEGLGLQHDSQLALMLWISIAICSQKNYHSRLSKIFLVQGVSTNQAMTVVVHQSMKVFKKIGVTASMGPFCTVARLS